MQGLLEGLGDGFACRIWCRACLMGLATDLLAGLGAGFACRS